MGTVARLLELGIPRSILAHTMNGIIAQRLVRKICDVCKEPYAPNPLALAHLGLQNSRGPWYRGKGCPACENTGYKGRTGIFSVLLLNDDLRAHIFDQKPLAEIQEYAIQHGMRTLKMDAAAKVLAGITNVEEAVRVI
jgi:type II secretory ATPase GspE/PulE/Tfp pilus assembly ATPase PilB-like protein